jgi:hypothetical protein
VLDRLLLLALLWQGLLLLLLGQELLLLLALLA